MASRPVAIDSIVCIEVVETDVVRLEGLIQILDLILNLLFLQDVSIFRSIMGKVIFTVMNLDLDEETT